LERSHLRVIDRQETQAKSQCLMATITFRWGYYTVPLQRPVPWREAASVCSNIRKRPVPIRERPVASQCV